MKSSGSYALIDPRDSIVECYVEGREAAREYARFLEGSACHSYKAAGVRLIVRKIP